MQRCAQTVTSLTNGFKGVPYSSFTPCQPKQAHTHTEAWSLTAMCLYSISCHCCLITLSVCVSLRDYDSRISGSARDQQTIRQQNNSVPTQFIPFLPLCCFTPLSFLFSFPSLTPSLLSYHLHQLSCFFSLWLVFFFLSVNPWSSSPFSSSHACISLHLLYTLVVNVNLFGQLSGKPGQKYLVSRSHALMVIIYRDTTSDVIILDIVIKCRVLQTFGPRPRISGPEKCVKSFTKKVYCNRISLEIWQWASAAKIN